MQNKYSYRDLETLNRRSNKHLNILQLHPSKTTIIKQEVPMLICQGPIIVHKVEKWHNSNNIAFRLMSLVLQLYLVMMSKYPKFGVDIFNTF